jgi:hypothetical protein
VGVAANFQASCGFDWNAIERTGNETIRGESFLEVVEWLDPTGASKGNDVRNRTLVVMHRFSKRYSTLTQDQFLERYGLRNSRSVARAFELFQRTFGVSTNVPRGTKTKTRPTGSKAWLESVAMNGPTITLRSPRLGSPQARPSPGH